MGLFDDIFDSEKGTVDEKEEIKEVVSVPSTEALKEKIESSPHKCYPELNGEDFPVHYLNIVKRMQNQYEKMPFLDYDKIYSELSDLSIKSTPTPTLQDLNDEIQKVQSAKDRLSEIFVMTLRNHTFKCRALDVLRDTWGRFSSENSADKRRGDAAFRLSEFEEDFANVEALLKSCYHILKTLDSLHESLSRRITVIQLQLKLHDFGRGALPDIDLSSYDRDGKGGNIFDNEENKENKSNKAENLTAEERSF